MERILSEDGRLDLANQEVRYIFTDRHRDIIQRREFSTFIRLIGLYHTNDLSRVYFYTIITDPVRRSVDRISRRKGGSAGS